MNIAADTTLHELIMLHAPKRVMTNALTDDTRLDELKFNDRDRVELWDAVETVLGTEISDLEWSAVETVGDVVRLAERRRAV
jgi:acyl carrier protein